jgi:hypothetical protein
MLDGLQRKFDQYQSNSNDANALRWHIFGSPLGETHAKSCDGRDRME